MWSVDSQESHYICCHQKPDFKVKMHQIQFWLGSAPEPVADLEGGKGPWPPKPSWQAQNAPKIVCRPGSARTHWGSLQRSPRPHSWIYTIWRLKKLKNVRPLSRRSEQRPYRFEDILLVTVGTTFGHLLLTKISKIVATRCHILRLKCNKIWFRWGSAPDPIGELKRSPRPIAEFTILDIKKLKIFRPLQRRSEPRPYRCRWALKTYY